MQNTYNGWYNYETWLTNLYFGDCLDSHTKYDGDELKCMLPELWEHEVEGLSGFLQDVINSFLGDVNWDEIAESHNFDVEEEDDETDCDEEE